MSWFKMFWPSGQAVQPSEPDPARRRLLVGLGVAACAASIGSLSFGGDARAASLASEGDLLDRIDDIADAADGDVELAHYTGYRHRHNRRSRRRERRRRRRYDCGNRRFRRNNPRLCGVPRRRRRYGRRCYRVGSVTVCD